MNNPLLDLCEEILPDVSVLKVPDVNLATLQSDMYFYDNVYSIVVMKYCIIIQNWQVRSIIKTPVILLSGGSMMWLLDEGTHRLDVPQNLIKNPNVSWCSLVPLGHSSIVTTTGLKWNLGMYCISIVLQ